MDAFTNFDPQLSRDGKKVLFGSRRDGNREYYLSDLAAPAAAPIAITHGPERAGTAVFSREGKSVIFTRDTGADENYRIYQVGLDGKNETCLIPGLALHRYPPLEAKDAPGTIVYAQRDAKSSGIQVVVQKIGGEPKVVFTQPGPGYVIGITRDGKRVLLRRRTSSTDFVLLDLELAGGKTRRLYPDEGKKATVHDAAYAPDGETVYVAADDGADGELLLAIDAATGAVEREYRQSDPPTAAIERVLVSPRGDRLAVEIDAGDHEEARFLDSRTMKVTSKVNAAVGDVVIPIRYSLDGAKVAAVVTSPARPTDVFAIDVRTGALEPLRVDRRPVLDELDPIETSIETVKGFDDPRVPREESDQVVRAARARGIPVEYQVAPDEGHSLDHRENRVEFMTRVARFLEDNAG